MPKKLNIDDLEIKKSERRKKPNYQTVQMLENTIERLKQEIEDIKIKARTAVKKDRTNAWRQKQYRIGKTTNDVRDMATELFYYRLRRDAGRKTAYVDAISGYPVLCKFVEGLDMDNKHLCVLIICYHFRFISRKELMYYGYSYTEASNKLTSLVHKGYLNRDTKHFKSSLNYSCLPKGDKLVEDFHDFYKKKTEKMFEEFKLKHKHHYVKPTLIKRKRKTGGEENGDQ